MSGAADLTGDKAPELASDREERIGFVLVFLSALFWSFGGAIGRFVEVDDSWTVVFWRSLWAACFLVGFMLWRDGRAGSFRLFRSMGLPGLAVAICFAIASTSFVAALAYTTVANIVLMQASVPLLAALISWLVFRQRVTGPTWIAIGFVILGVGIMVSDSLRGGVNLIGDGLALTIAVVFSIATVITRRYSHVRMTPATCLGVVLAGIFAATQAGTLSVGAVDMAWLFAFGAINLGLGMALFASGARLIPAPAAALLGTFEPVLGPVWVWLVHGEIPSSRTVVGGCVVIAALMVHIAMEFRRHSRPARPGVTGMPTPR